MSKGGGGGSSVPEKTTQTVINQPWSGVADYLKGMYGQANTLSKDPMEYFKNQTFPLRSPLTEAGQQGALGYATNVLPGYQETGNEALQAMLGSVDVAANPYVNKMLESQAGLVGDTLNRQWLPQIRSGAINSGQLGGSRQGIAEGLAMGEASKALSNAAAQTQLSAYGQGMEQQRAGAALLPTMAQMGLMPSQLYGQVGGQQEAYNQQIINDAMARNDYANMEPWQRVNMLNSVLSSAPWGSSTTQKTSGTSGGSSTMGGILGGGLTGYGIGNALGASGTLGTAISTGLNLPAYMGLGIPGMILGAALGGILG